MAGNGDERQAAAWERVEAKLDRIGEKVDRLERLAELADRRLKRLEDDNGLMKLLLEAVRHEVDNKIAQQTDELLSGLGREMRIELLAAQTLNDDRVSKLERRVDALEAAKA